MMSVHIQTCSLVFQTHKTLNSVTEADLSPFPNPSLFLVYHKLIFRRMGWRKKELSGDKWKYFSPREKNFKEHTIPTMSSEGNHIKRTNICVFSVITFYMNLNYIIQKMYNIKILIKSQFKDTFYILQIFSTS